MIFRDLIGKVLNVECDKCGPSIGITLIG